MELVLNLAWLSLALCMAGLWLRVSPAAARERCAQFVALALVIVILLPVISVTDDLLAAQNPAEIDTSVSLRRDHDWLTPHAVVPVAVAILQPLFARFTPCPLRMTTMGRVTFPVLSDPAIAPIENRPPPRA